MTFIPSASVTPAKTSYRRLRVTRGLIPCNSFCVRLHVFNGPFVCDGCNYVGTRIRVEHQAKQKQGTFAFIKYQHGIHVPSHHLYTVNHQEAEKFREGFNHLSF